MEIKPIDTLGGRETSHLYLTDCEAPADAVLGEVDQAWMQLMAGLNVERLILAATMLGLGRRAFDDALAYVKERRQFGARSAPSRRSSTGSPTSRPSSRRRG